SSPPSPLSLHDALPIFRVLPGAFRPPPKVESAVVHMVVHDAPRVPIEDEHRFRVVVRAAFAHRRKTLGNALASTLGWPAERVRRSEEHTSELQSRFDLV